MPRRSRWEALDGARGLLVGSVVLYHASRLVLTRHGGDWGDVAPMWWPLAVGRLGVDGFFVLAGFLIVGSWDQCRARAETGGAAIRAYAARRCWRILPPYLAMLAVVVPLAAPQLLRPSHLGDLVRLVSLQQYLDAALPAEVNLPIWSLTTEVHFYVVAPLVALAIARLGGWRVWVPAAALAVWWSQATLRGDLASGLLPGRLDQFVIGAAAGALVLRWERGERPRLATALARPRVEVPLVIALLAVGVFQGATFGSGTSTALTAFVHPVAGLLLAGLLVRIVCGSPLKTLAHPLLRWLGTISFSLYLWHYPILDRGFGALGLRSPLQPRIAVLAGAIVLVILAVALAAIAHHAVELPSLRWKAALDTRRERRSTVSETELRLEDVQEVALAEHDEARGPRRSSAGDRVALLERPQGSAVD